MIHLFFGVDAASREFQTMALPPRVANADANVVLDNAYDAQLLAALQAGLAQLLAGQAQLLAGQAQLLAGLAPLQAEQAQLLAKIDNARLRTINRTNGAAAPLGPLLPLVVEAVGWNAVGAVPPGLVLPRTAQKIHSMSALAITAVWAAYNYDPALAIIGGGGRLSTKREALFSYFTAT